MKLLVILPIAILFPAWIMEATAQNYSVEKVREIPIDLGDEIVGEIADLTRDAEGNYYLPDWQQHTIWVTNPQGKLIRRIG